jgi:hypothetical protein
MPKNLITALIAAACIAGSAIAASAIAADVPDATDKSAKLQAGLTPTVELLQLMDTDKNGKVSKEEFMRYMEAEFDLADTNKDKELDPKELKHLIQNLYHPTKGPGR